ncbi:MULTISPECIES: hypothetical protein [unclassified Psychrobacter]|uniref:hypothetical protein n=1 Tax=unclassified Psychrobacter TaxID=196806 RepID=UPI00071E6A45|nr:MULTISPECIES: hypothetical protein [unclassified Psychrobacter]OLF39145.1 hypothetical protein BTV98_01665 [Psychrobacter sp. Cmf 22.2]
MSIFDNADKTYITLTPAGVFEAFSQHKPTAQQLALQALLSYRETMLVAVWLEEYSERWLNSFVEQGFIEKLSTFLPAPNLPLDQFLPYVVASLSGKRRAAIASDEGFCLARIGYSQEEADMLSVAAADFSGFMLRQKQRGWAIESQAISFFQQVDLLIPETSFVFLWIDGDGYALIIDGEPLTNNRAFVELIWGIKTSGLRFDSSI